MIFTNHVYSFIPKNSSCKYGYFPPHRRYSVEKCQPLLWLYLMTLGIKKVEMDMSVFPSQVLVLTNIFVPLNYASIIIEYNQRMQSYFGGQTWGLHILINNTAKMMCYCYETIIIGHTCVENNQVWPDWLVWKGVKSEKASSRKL